MSSKNAKCRSFCGISVKAYCKFVFRRSCKGIFGKFTQGNRDNPGRYSGALGTVLQDLPEEMLSRSGVPTHAQWAVYIALTLFALHQQGKRFAEGIYVSARKRSGKGSGLFDTW